MTGRDRFSSMLLTLFSSLLVLAAFAAAALGPGLNGDLNSSAACLAAAAAGYVLAVFAAVRAGDNRKVFIVIVVFSCLARIAAFFMGPELTTDFYRYIWDGKVAASGVNPYRYAPDAQELEHLRNPDIHGNINFSESPTSYGPAALAVFRVFYAVAGENLVMWRVLFLLAEMLVMALLAALLARERVPLTMLAVYSLNPLVLVELCANIHLDSIMLLFLVASLWMLRRNRSYPAVLLLAGAALVKYFPAALLPLYLAKVYSDAPDRKVLKAAGAAALFVFAAAAFFIPHLQQGVDIFAGVKYYSNQLTVTSYSPYYYMAENLGGSAADAAAAIIVVLAGAAGFLMAADRRFYPYLFFFFAAVALLVPVQRPWYFTWAVPFCCFFPSRPWIVFSCAALLTYGLIFDYDYIYGAKFAMYWLLYWSIALSAALWLARRNGAKRTG